MSSLPFRPEASTSPDQLRLERILDFALVQLGVDAVYLWEFRDGWQQCRACTGATSSFRVVPEDALAIQNSYSHQMAAGRLPNLIRDTGTEERVADLEITSRAHIAAYVGVPVRHPDGALWGALSAVSHTPRPDLDQSAVKTLSLLAGLLVFDAEEHSRRKTMLRDIERFITDGGFDVAYQPIVDMVTGECIGLEALARFPEPYRSPPQAFGAAERIGLGVQLEVTVVRRALEILPTLSAGHLLTLNISPAALLDCTPWEQMWRDGMLPLPRLVVEVTEHAAISAYASLRKELQPWRERGLRIAVDDAGAGYASLRHILELRPDFIKLDRWLIDGLAEDGARRVAVGSFVALARELGAGIIAEGIERPEDLEAVSHLGIDAAQGYLLGRPSSDRGTIARWCTGSGPAPWREWTVVASAERPRTNRLAALRTAADPADRVPELGSALGRGLVEVDATVGRELDRLEADRRLSQRLAAVGQLAAGIAHEINTPLQFVGDSVSFLREAVADLLNLTDVYHETLYSDGPASLEQRRRAICDAEQEADLEYLRERIPGAFERTVDGIGRVRSIVQAMKRFSHAGAGEVAPADINEGLQTTLVVCRNEYKYVADVTVDLSPLPEIVCNISELNQVFLNLIINAAQALEEQVAQGAERGKITVRTQQRDECIVIDIADTGPGIPAGLLDRIYEPFFTTKPIGKGTGQGLALALATINRHGGSLDCVSAPGQGTTFTITLPLQASAAPSPLRS
ncbi:MAG TPA: EAL domain-containing protein [Solirubrobacteraceae bacterium]|nr:EAL domain-containing protein [Solirubrobacteraceae bacterium]